MDYAALIPLLLQALDVVAQVKTDLKAGGNVATKVETIAPHVIPFIRDVAKVLFPGLPPTAQTAAGTAMLTPDYVRALQTLLNKKNVAGSKLVVDGVYGAATKAAAVKYQQDHGLTADGWVGPLTLKSLQSA